MLLVKPSVEILAINNNPLQLIEIAGRTCYKSEDKISDGTAEKFAQMILNRGHESVIEHASATVRFICDRGVSHEIVRHRLASYSQESTRYCDYQNGHVCFVIPQWVSVKEGEHDQIWLIDDETIAHSSEAAWFNAMLNAESAYRYLREQGWRPEQARAVLPNSLKTEVVMTANLREWRHFLKLRTSAAAHPQMREVSIPLLHKMKKACPIIFEDIKGEN